MEIISIARTVEGRRFLSLTAVGLIDVVRGSIIGDIRGERSIGWHFACLLVGFCTSCGILILVRVSVFGVGFCTLCGSLRYLLEDNRNLAPFQHYLIGR